MDATKEGPGAPAPEPLDPERTRDVGDTLCGELALLLRRELGRLEAGQVLLVIARDPAAPQDLPAWCEVTDHRLVRAAPPSAPSRRPSCSCRARACGSPGAGLPQRELLTLREPKTPRRER